MSDPIAPPAAPDLPTVYSFVSAVEPVVKMLMGQSGLFQVLESRDPDDEVTPRVELKLEVGAMIQRVKIQAGLTDRRDALPCAYNVNLAFTVVTDRLKVPAQNHDAMVATVRVFGATYFSALNSYLAYHRFEDLNEGGTRGGMSNEKAESQDISVVTFPGKLRIRDTAWPVGT